MIPTVPFTPADTRPRQPASARALLLERGIWLSLTLSLTLSLCVTNVLILLDRDYRNSAYEVVARMAAWSVLQPIGLSRIAKAVEDANPVALEKIAIAQATERLMESEAALRREIAVLKNQRLVLAVARLNLQKELRNSRTAMALHKDRMSALGEKVLGRAARSVTRHLAALPGHALPVLSATVAVGSAALDIHDACESLKEVDDVNKGVDLPSVNRSGVCGQAVPTADDLLADAQANWRKVYEASAEALNIGAQIIPRSPPPISFESARKWVSGTLGR